MTRLNDDTLLPLRWVAGISLLVLTGGLWLGVLSFKVEAATKAGDMLPTILEDLAEIRGRLGIPRRK